MNFKISLLISIKKGLWDFDCYFVKSVIGFGRNDYFMNMLYLYINLHLTISVFSMSYLTNLKLMYFLIMVGVISCILLYVFYLSLPLFLSFLPFLTVYFWINYILLLFYIISFVDKLAVTLCYLSSCFRIHHMPL